GSVDVARTGTLDAHHLGADTHFLQVFQQLRRHAFRQIDQRVVVADVDAADVFAVEVGLVGDRTHDVARLHAMGVADFDAEGFHSDVRYFAARTRGGLGIGV